MTGLVPDGGAGSLSPSLGEEGLWALAAGGGVAAGQAACDWRSGAGWEATPEAAPASQLVSWTVME